MRRLSSFSFASIIAASLMCAEIAHAEDPIPPRLLVFTRTTDFRHESIPAAVTALRTMGAEARWELDFTEDAGAFTTERLARYDAVIFLLTTGDVLDAAGRDALESFIAEGNGWVGIHSASDTEHGWPWYEGLVGAYFADHSDVTQAEIRVADRVHPATSSLPRRWRRRDEWYNFDHNPRSHVHVLASIDERSYVGGRMRGDHPISWCQVYSGGRAFYTALGHTAESYAEPELLAHLRGGILYAAGRSPGDCEASLASKLETTVLDDDTTQPMALAVAPDGRVFFIERRGRVRVHRPDLARTVTAATLLVDADREDGLLGLALDPAFETNGYVYLYYSPAGASLNRLARFETIGDELAVESERVILEIPTQREQCCHSSGYLAFGPDGLLYLSTGDNVNPWDSAGYAPIDERADRRTWDSQGTSANTLDLRGKLLRIRVLEDGSYAIPLGNLFIQGTPQTRPEIYAMGLRNPFRYSIDRFNRVWLGDVGPDAALDDPLRGPRGYDELNRIATAGNYGWPYCLGPNLPFVDYDFATMRSAAPYSCANPINDSPHNGGLRRLPPARPSVLHYEAEAAPVQWPAIGRGSRTIMAGPTYRYDPMTEGMGALPAHYDGALFLYDWSRSWVRAAILDDEGGILEILPFLSDGHFAQPIDMKLDSNGFLYVLEYGTGWGDNPDARLVRVSYRGGARPPEVEMETTPTSGATPLVVLFRAVVGGTSPEEEPLDFSWDLDGDGAVDATGPEVTYTYTQPGAVETQLRVRNALGRVAVRNRRIVAGNTAPSVRFVSPPAGGFFRWGEPIRVVVGVDDVEDGSSAGCGLCAEVEVVPALGHNTHAHDGNTQRGCVLDLRPERGDHESANLSYIVKARYTDQGASGTVAIESSATLVLHPSRLEAEHASSSEGVINLRTSDPMGGGEHAGYLERGDWLSFRGLDLRGIDRISARVASESTGGLIEVRASSAEGPLLATVVVPSTGDWAHYTTVEAAIVDPGGAHDLYLVFDGELGDRPLFDVNWIEMIGEGVSGDRGGASHGACGGAAPPPAPQFGEEDGCSVAGPGMRGAHARSSPSYALMFISALFAALCRRRRLERRTSV